MDARLLMILRVTVAAPLSIGAVLHGTRRTNDDITASCGAMRQRARGWPAIARLHLLYDLTVVGGLSFWRNAVRVRAIRMPSVSARLMSPIVRVGAGFLNRR